jgi:hypothetical protein
LAFEPQQLSFDQQQLSMFDRLQFSWLMLIPIEVKLYVRESEEQVGTPSCKRLQQPSQGKTFLEDFEATAKPRAKTQKLKARG